MNEITAYILSLIATVFVATLVGILAPSGDGGLARHLRLLTSLVLICVLISPALSLAEGVRDLLDGNFSFEGDAGVDEDYSSALEESMNETSKHYFVQMLTQTLAERFSIAEDDIRCRVEWETEGEHLRPTRVTVVLSGSAIWKNPAEIEKYVTSLLGCECVSAIE